MHIRMTLASCLLYQSVVQIIGWHLWVFEIEERFAMVVLIAIHHQYCHLEDGHIYRYCKHQAINIKSSHLIHIIITIYLHHLHS